MKIDKLNDWSLRAALAYDFMSNAYEFNILNSSFLRYTVNYDLEVFHSQAIVLDSIKDEHLELINCLTTSLIANIPQHLKISDETIRISKPSELAAHPPFAIKLYRHADIVRLDN